MSVWLVIDFASRTKRKRRPRCQDMLFRGLGESALRLIGRVQPLVRRERSCSRRKNDASEVASPWGSVKQLQSAPAGRNWHPGIRPTEHVLTVKYGPHPTAVVPANRRGHKQISALT